jgi:hypothetical protein
MASNKFVTEAVSSVVGAAGKTGAMAVILFPILIESEKLSRLKKDHYPLYPFFCRHLYSYCGYSAATIGGMNRGH